MSAMPKEVAQWLEQNRIDIKKVLREIPDTRELAARPVWARHLRRIKGSEIGPPTDEERADAIEVLRQDGLGIRSLHVEATRILEECST